MKSIIMGDLKIVDRKGLGMDIFGWNKKTKKYDRKLTWFNDLGCIALMRWLKEKYKKNKENK